MGYKPRFVGLGRVGRPHGIPRGGRRKFKLQFFSRGGLALQGQAAVWLFPGEAPLSPEWGREVELAGPPKPLDGSWGSATGAILEVPESDFPEPGALVALPRERLPLLPAGEFYMVDFLGRELSDPNSGLRARIEGFQDFADTLGGSPNVELCDTAGRRFSIPWAWLPRAELERASRDPDSSLVIEGLEAWASLDQGPQAPDDEDERPQ